MLWNAVLLISTVICAAGWLNARIELRSMVYYMCKHQLPTPDEEEFRQCVRATVRHLLGRD